MCILRILASVAKISSDNDGDSTIIKYKSKQKLSSIWFTFYRSKRRVTDEGDNDAKTRNKKLIFKNNAPFRLCI